MVETVSSSAQVKSSLLRTVQSGIPLSITGCFMDSLGSVSEFELRVYVSFQVSSRREIFNSTTRYSSHRSAGNNACLEDRDPLWNASQLFLREEDAFFRSSFAPLFEDYVDFLTFVIDTSLRERIVVKFFDSFF